MHIRVLTPNDAAAYKQLRLLSLQESPLAFSESLEDEAQKEMETIALELTAIGQPPASFVLGAFSHENELWGFVTFKRDQRSKALHKSMIHALYVTPAQREKKIGAALINTIISYARQLNGLEQIHLWVLYADSSATDFYKKMGFISQGTLVKNDLKIGDIYVDAAYMVLYL